jgi:hypothetical protein
VVASVCDGLIESRARGLLRLFQRKNLLPHTPRFLAALGDLDGVRVCFDKGGNDLATVNDAFMRACHWEHEAVASFLLDQAIALDPGLGIHIDGGDGRAAFIRYLMAGSLTFTHAAPTGPWQAFLMHQVVRAIDDNALDTFANVLRRESGCLAIPASSFRWD